MKKGGKGTTYEGQLILKKQREIVRKEREKQVKGDRSIYDEQLMIKKRYKRDKEELQKKTEGDEQGDYQENVGILRPINCEIYVGNIFNHSCNYKKVIYKKCRAAILNHDGEIKYYNIKRCNNCRKFFLGIKEYEKKADLFSEYRKVFFEDSKKMQEYMRKNGLDVITPQRFLVRCSTRVCTSKEHKMLDIWARIEIVTSEGERRTTEVPASYCLVCGNYYILERDYKGIFLKGSPLCRIIKQKKNVSHYGESFFDTLNIESIMHSFGYNVAKNKHLTIFQRRVILEFLVDNKILSAGEICSHLDFLLKFHTAEKYDNACRKWEEDRKYISNYVTRDSIVDIETILY